jgi:predicted DNA binding CopG/RHH family protein
MKRVNIHLSEDQIERLRKQSDRTGIPVAELVRRAIDYFPLTAKKKGRAS